MAVYSLSLASTVGSSGAPAWDCKPGSGNSPRVMEFGFINGTTTSCNQGLGRGGSTSTQTGAVALQPENPADPAAASNCAIAWSAAPTQPTQMLRRTWIPATLGAGIIFTFPRGIVLAQGGVSLVLWNLAASSAIAVATVIVDE